MPDKNGSLLNLKSPWMENGNPIWIASNIALRRNVDRYKFPTKMADDRRKQIVQLCSKEILHSPLLKNPQFLKAEDLGPLEKEFLVEHYLSDETFQQAHVGEGFIIDDTGEFLFSINIKDHIHIQIIDVKGELEGSWNKLIKIEDSLSSSITYAFSSQFGFLTSDPYECGTGLHVTAYLQLSGLIHSGKLEETLEKTKEDSIEIKHFLDQEKPIGDLILATNRYTLGVNEETILGGVRSFTAKMITHELNIRQKIGSEESADIKDKVSRAYAILMHSYQLEALEALNALSLIKLGLEFNWVKGVPLEVINELLFNSRRSHLLRSDNDKIAPEQIPHKRAEFIHNLLKGKLELNL